MITTPKELTAYLKKLDPNQKVYVFMYGKSELAEDFENEFAESDNELAKEVIANGIPDELAEYVYYGFSDSDKYWEAINESIRYDISRWIEGKTNETKQIEELKLEQELWN